MIITKYWEVDVKAIYKVSVFACIFFLVVPVVQAQNNPYDEVSIASPTAASLAKYADIPVNYYTGIPSVSIPVYTVKEGPLSLPISLSYHASGLKVMELASWVGAGWSLNAGGVITRSVQGAPDERLTSSVQNQEYGYFSDYGYPSYYYKAGHEQDWSAFANGYKDGEPDLYFFSFNGISGKFYFREDRTPVLLPQQDLRIEPVYCNPACDESISSWIITTPDGTTYHFGKHGAAVEPVDFTRPFTQTNSMSYSNVISSWYLNKIVSADGLFEINLEYESEHYSYYTLATFPISPASNDDAYKLVKNMVEGVRLSAITFSTGRMDFFEGSLREDVAGYDGTISETSNTQARVLDRIQISNANSSLCREFAFTYNYFTDNTNSLRGHLSGLAINTDRKRLKLDSVREQTCDGSTTIPPYSFTYYDETEVPRRLSFARDHWGFYNGATQNDQLIPTYYVNDYDEINGADREPSWPEMRAGALKRIDRPTGGYTEFEFEPHETFVSYQALEHLGLVALLTTGYDSNPWNETTFTVNSSDPYEVRVRNDDEGGSAVAYFYDEDGNNYESVHAEEGETVEEILDLRIGLNKVRVWKEEPSGSPPAGVSVGVTGIKKTTYEDNLIVGGLRIKNITHQDGTSVNPAVVKSFEYITNYNGRSTGILYSRPVYAAVIRNDLIRDYGFYEHAPEGCLGLEGYSQPYYISPSSLRPMESTQGNHIGYNEVKVTQSDGGYTIYQYYGSSVYDDVTDGLSNRRVFPNECTADIPNFPAAPPPIDFYRGQLARKWVFDASEKQQASWEYFPTYEEEKAGTPAFIAQRYGSSRILGTKYELKTAKLTEMKVIKTQYGKGGDPPLRTTTLTIYGNQQKATEECKSTRTSCEANFDNSLSSCSISYYDALSSCGSDNECKKQAWLDFEQCQFQAREDYLNCWENYSCNHHLLPAQVQATNSDRTQRITDYTYAHEITNDGRGVNYTPMYNLHMLSQPYSVTVSDSAGKVLRKRWILWRHDATGDRWLRDSEWIWTGGDPDEPVFETNN